MLEIISSGSEDKSFKTATAIGAITTDPYFNVVSNGYHHSNFYVRYQTEKTDAKTLPKTIAIECWGEWADFCRQLEKNDVVLVKGRYVYDEYNSKKTGKSMYKIVAEFIYPQGLLIQQMKGNLPEESFGNATEEPNGDTLFD